MLNEKGPKMIARCPQRALLQYALVAILGIAALGLRARSAQTAPSPAAETPGRPLRGLGSGMPGGARGMFGTVTEVAADHYVVKNESGELYSIFFSANTRILKQPAARRQNNAGRPDASPDDSQRQPPQSLKPSEIKVGNVITAAGEVDASKRSIGAIFIAQIDPERAKQMRAMQAQYGKTWLAGRVTAIDGTKITIEGMLDHTSHTLEVDENTSFHQRRESITLADIKPGQQLRAEGAIKDGVFLATLVNAVNPQEQDPSRNRAPAQQP